MLIKRKLMLVLMLFLILTIGACRGKQSAIEGKLVDGNGKPVPMVKIIASQVKLIKGYEQLEAITNSDGKFRINGLFPSSRYVLKPLSEKWACLTSVTLDSAPQGETVLLSSPMVIDKAFSRNNGSLVFDLITGATRFAISSDGVITDAKTDLQWLVGPDNDTNYEQAIQWLENCKVAGGGWFMPTIQELSSLYENGIGKRNMDPVFKTTGWYVWAKPGEPLSWWGFDFKHGNSEYWRSFPLLGFLRVFGVRARPR